MSSVESSRPALGVRRRTAARLSAGARRFLLNDGELDSVRAGRLLLAVQGLLVAATAGVLHPKPSDMVCLAVLSIVMTALLLASSLIPWQQLPSTASVAFALASVGAFFVLGVCTAATFAPVTGFLTLTVIYAGLTQPLRVAAWVVPVAGMALGVNYTPFTGAIVVRVLVAMSVWAVAAVTLCWLTRLNRETAATLRRSALVDALTGIPNRRDLETRLDGLRDEEVVVLLDIDHFKRINDTEGHEAGDQVLSRFGTLLRDGLRGTDYCARLGGEEFVIIFDASTSHMHQAVIDRLRVRWTRVQPGVTFSTGCATARPNRVGRKTLDTADQALYLAKSSGRNTDRAESDLRDRTPAVLVP